MPLPTLADLSDPTRYALILRLEFNNLLPFVSEYYLRRRNRVVIANYLLNLANLAALLWLGILLRLDFAAWISAAGWAVLVMLALVPLHELLHALAYRLFGARDIRFGVLLRQGAAYAGAHHFVVSAPQLVWMALLPFLVINGACLLAAILSPELRFLALMVSLAHLSAVAGDWAILGYLWEQRAAALFTYDDLDLKTSFFFNRL